MVQMKNRISGLLMETGVSHNKQRLHKVGYFRELLATPLQIAVLRGSTLGVLRTADDLRHDAVRLHSCCSTASRYTFTRSVLGQVW
jgi:hypothetical protein